MARKSLRPHLNQIRAWVRQGRTDAWVAHQLEVSVREIEQFKRQNELVSDDQAGEGVVASNDYPDEVDLRAEDDALIAAELEAAELEAAEERAERERAQALEQEQASSDKADADTTGENPEAAPARRRGRRGGRRRGATRANAGALEGTFDHGEEGYGLWLDPAIQDNPVYAEHWAGHRPVEVSVEEDRIVIRRTGSGD